MNCKDFREIVDSYLSDELLTETNHDVILHIENCPQCSALIKERRDFRARLRSAVTSSAKFALPDGFNHRLLTRIRHERDRSGKPSYSWFGLRLVAGFAGVLVVAVIAFSVFNYVGRSPSPDYMVSGFADDSLINIASGDHQHCAIKHDLEEAPIALSDAEPRYRGLEELVGDNLNATLGNHKLVEAHACKYRDVQFAHLVMKDDSNTISVLIARDLRDGEVIDKQMREFASPAFEITTFGAAEERVFVISGKGSGANRKASKALLRPLEQHFSDQEQFQTALFRGLSNMDPAPYGQTGLYRV